MAEIEKNTTVSTFLVDGEHEDLQVLEKRGWLLGVICAGRWDNSPKGRLTKNPAFVEAFSQAAQEVFLVEGAFRVIKFAAADEKQLYGVSWNPIIDAEFADITGENWPEVLRQRYPWIEQGETYARAFIRGYFDLRGGVSTTDVTPYVRLNASSQAAAEYLGFLAKAAGLPDFHTNDGLSDSGSFCAKIMQKAGIILFAQQITSTDNTKEAWLAGYRQMEFGKTAATKKNTEITEDNYVDVFNRVQRKNKSKSLGKWLAQVDLVYQHMMAHITHGEPDIEHTVNPSEAAYFRKALYWELYSAEFFDEIAIVDSKKAALEEYKNILATLTRFLRHKRAIFEAVRIINDSQFIQDSLGDLLLPHMDWLEGEESVAHWDRIMRVYTDMRVQLGRKLIELFDAQHDRLYQELYKKGDLTGVMIEFELSPLDTYTAISRIS